MLLRDVAQRIVIRGEQPSVSNATYNTNIPSVRSFIERELQRKYGMAHWKNSFEAGGIRMVLPYAKMDEYIYWMKQLSNDYLYIMGMTNVPLAPIVGNMLLQYSIQYYIHYTTLTGQYQTVFCAFYDDMKLIVDTIQRCLVEFLKDHNAEKVKHPVEFENIVSLQKSCNEFLSLTNNKTIQDKIDAASGERLKYENIYTMDPMWPSGMQAEEKSEVLTRFCAYLYLWLKNFENGPDILSKQKETVLQIQLKIARHGLREHGVFIDKNITDAFFKDAPKNETESFSEALNLIHGLLNLYKVLLYKEVFLNDAGDPDNDYAPVGTSEDVVKISYPDGDIRNRTVPESMQEFAAAGDVHLKTLFARMDLLSGPHKYTWTEWPLFLEQADNLLQSYYTGSLEDENSLIHESNNESDEEEEEEEEEEADEHPMQKRGRHSEELNQPKRQRGNEEEDEKYFEGTKAKREKRRREED